MAEVVRVKICGLTRREDALVADAAGADYLGVVLSPGFGRSVDLAAARSIVEGTGARKVAVLVDESADDAEAAALALGADVVQLHGNEDAGVVDELRSRGRWKLWKAVRARSTRDVQVVVDRYGGVVDGVLVEGWLEGVTGGGGARLELEPREVRAAIPTDLDFVLAGGLAPDNVGRAVERFGPTVVDVSSGVERSVGEKEPHLVRGFVRAARAAARRPERDFAS